MINLFHAIIVFGMLLTIGIMNVLEKNVKDTGIFLICLAIVIILYHGFQYYKKYNDGN